MPIIISLKHYLPHIFCIKAKKSLKLLQSSLGYERVFSLPETGPFYIVCKKICKNPSKEVFLGADL